MSWYKRPPPPFRRVFFWIGALGAGTSVGLLAVQFKPDWAYAVLFGISTTLMLVTAEKG